MPEYGLSAYTMKVMLKFVNQFMEEIVLSFLWILNSFEWRIASIGDFNNG